MTSVVQILAALPWFAWIPIVAIVSGSVCGTFKMLIIHRERMAMIRNGIHPDSVTAKPTYEQSEV
jgi:ABC-type nitrate/sulfonate/bicarbonate transport system permease component